MDNADKIKYLEDGYGCWGVRDNNINPANVTAVIDSLLANPAIKGAFHRERKEIWIKYTDSKNVPSNRIALETAFNVNTF